jgi:hypothetical protein
LALRQIEAGLDTAEHNAAGCKNSLAANKVLAFLASSIYMLHIVC